MRGFLFLFLIAVCGTAVGQSTFPSSFIDHWEGALEWYSSGKSTPQVVKMGLIVRPTDSAGTYTWQIIYGDAGQDNRPYRLLPVDTAKGHWRIDENNGIVLDQWWVDNRFIAAFTVGGTTILNSSWREGEALVVEFYSLSAKPMVTTGSGTADSPPVDSYAAKGFQRARLLAYMIRLCLWEERIRHCV